MKRLVVSVVLAAVLAGFAVYSALASTGMSDATTAPQVTVVQATQTFVTVEYGTVTATCPSGTVAVGGGGSGTPNGPATGPPSLIASEPSGNPPTGWTAEAGYEVSNGGFNYTVTAYAVCMTQSRLRPTPTPTP
jgi:hypothetical protein